MEFSKILHNTLGVVFARIKEIVVKRKLKKFNPGKYLLNPMPVYISQLANANPKLIEGFYGKIKDENAAKRFGTKDLDEFSYWAWRSCGIVGVQSIITTLEKAKGRKFKKTTMELVNECLSLKGYDIKKDKGWYHKSLVALAKNYKIRGFLHKFISSSEIALILANKRYVLASIKSDTGGHLLLLYGFKLDNKGKLEGFVYHDPNNFEKDGENNFVLKQDFDKLTTRRVISFNGAFYLKREKYD